MFFCLSQSQVDIEETADQGPKYFVLTFVLCGVIAGVVLAVIAVYMVKRHSHFKNKLINLAAASNDTPAASSDYQVSCCALQVTPSARYRRLTPC